MRGKSGRFIFAIQSNPNVAHHFSTLADLIVFKISLFEVLKLSSFRSENAAEFKGKRQFLSKQER